MAPTGAPMQPLELRQPASPSDVTELRLPNGLLVRFLVLPASPDSGPARAGMRLTVPGGRAADLMEGRPGASEAMLLTLDGAGVGQWSREEVQLYRCLNSVSTELRSTADVLELDVHFAPSASSCRAALEWLHWALKEPKLDLSGFTDAQLRMKGNANAREKSLEGRAVQELLEGMYPSAPWLAEAHVQEVNRLTLGLAKRAGQSQLSSVDGLELDIAVCVAPRSGSAASLVQQHEGASAAEQTEEVSEMRRTLEREVGRCLGSLPAAPVGVARPAPPSPSASSRGFERRVHVPDKEARALVVIGGTAPGYWGCGDSVWQTTTRHQNFSWGPRAAEHPLYPARATELMAECLSTRLLGRVRDQLSLTYNCEIELTMYEGFPAGHFMCKVFSFPEKLHQAAAATMEVLRSPDWLPFTDREIEASKRVMAYREGRSRREDRSYWLGRLKPLPGSQGGSGLPPGDRPAEEDKLLESLGAEDVQLAWRAFGGLDDPFVVLATSGPPQVAAMLPPTAVVSRSDLPAAVAAERAAAAAAAPRAGGGASMSFLD
ncbi:unnamed protein product [Polarella glacialis]|uniref:Peptidase M16 C-terminal domain-containing protein n=1 Tax=Polarella glacialis TaxID=89957 RepID=A0A813FWH2_POLGL|nr:unnamed protein product [Polarella glacialis]CAE8734470.1 unnamed protein product [Polarella glacialis]